MTSVSSFPAIDVGSAPSPSMPGAPYTGWSPIPSQIPPIRGPQVREPAPAVSPCLQFGALTKGKCVVPAQQPVVPVPIYQEVQRKDRIVEVPQTVVTDSIVPRLFHQQVHYDVPLLSVNIEPQKISIPRAEYREKIIEVPVPVGYNYKVVSKWEIREVPKVIPKYVGEQEKIMVEVPQVRIVDKNIEKEVPVFVGEKAVPKLVVQEDPVEVTQYRYVEQEEEVPVYKYKPVFDVEVDIPPPLIVPVPLFPSEIQLDPEKVSLDDWKRARTACSKCCTSSCSGCC